jgi:hypothetical protein
VVGVRRASTPRSSGTYDVNSSTYTYLAWSVATSGVPLEWRIRSAIRCGYRLSVNGSPVRADCKRTVVSP